jgi:hypothetical protein
VAACCRHDQHQLLLLVCCNPTYLLAAGGAVDAAVPLDSRSSPDPEAEGSKHEWAENVLRATGGDGCGPGGRCGGDRDPVGGGGEFPIYPPPGIIILLAGAIFVSLGSWPWTPVSALPSSILAADGPAEPVVRVRGP